MEHIKLALQCIPLLQQLNLALLKNSNLLRRRRLAKLPNSLYPAKSSQHLPCSSVMRTPRHPSIYMCWGCLLTCSFCWSCFSCAPVSVPTMMTAARPVAHTPALTFVARDHAERAAGADMTTFFFFFSPRFALLLLFLLLFSQPSPWLPPVYQYSRQSLWQRMSRRWSADDGDVVEAALLEEVWRRGRDGAMARGGEDEEEEGAGWEVRRWRERLGWRGRSSISSAVGAKA